MLAWLSLPSERVRMVDALREAELRAAICRAEVDALPGKTWRDFEVCVPSAPLSR